MKMSLQSSEIEEKSLCIKLSIEHSTTCDSRTNLNHIYISTSRIGSRGKCLDEYKSRLGKQATENKAVAKYTICCEWGGAFQLAVTKVDFMYRQLTAKHNTNS